MQDLIVTLVQADQLWEDKTANLAAYDKLLVDVVDSNLIVLPEMFHTAFSMNVGELGESIENGVGTNWLKKTAREKNSAIYTSLITKDKDVYYNTGIFVTPSGDVSIYNKRKSFGLAKEDQFFKAGDQEVIVNYLGWNIQLQICYDLRFPEIVRNKLNSDGSPNYDLILYVANWPEKRSLHWKTLLMARAIENQSYVVGVNRVGEDGKGLVYSGDSMSISPLGETYCLPPNQIAVDSVTLNSKDLQGVRTALPFLKDQ